MCARLEQLLQIKTMCLNELKQAQANCEHNLVYMTALSENMTANWQDSNYFLTEYDAAITNIATILEATRKFNISMELNSKIHRDMPGVMSRTKQRRSEQCKQITETLKKSGNNVIPAEECDFNSEAVDDFVYPTLNLNKVYKPNDVIIGTVTYIKNLKNLTFFIFDLSCEYRAALVELSKSLELRQYNNLPTAHEVFGCVLDNKIFRAVLGNKTYCDVEMNEEIIPCYILDTGEILPLKSEHTMYKLTNDQKIIPALAIPCRLITEKSKNPFMTKKTMEDKLKQSEYEKCHFKIVKIENNTLLVELIDETNIINTGDSLENQSVEKVILQESSRKEDEWQLTKEELDILYEEPLSTSNAMKAVMGYDPQDDKRICRFYNPLTGGCFKGVNCKLEHTSRQPDGYTKDVIPTSSIMDSQHPITIYAPDSVINITPTYIGQLDRFFAQINEPNQATSPLVWNNEDVPSWKLLRHPPHMFEIVLSRYSDGLWYRAKVMSHDDNYKMFEVLYVDYGNTQLVHLRNLASMDISMAQLPFQAVLCRFKNVSEKHLTSEERKNCIEILCEMILNKSINVKVISHYEDLFISFVDKDSYPLPDVLIEMGYLEVNKNNIIL